MPFRDDILRGIRLFAISFAVLLACVWAYRVTRAPSGVEGANRDLPAPSEAAPAPAPPSDTPSANAHPLVVPPPPPVHRVTRVLRADDTVPPPPSRASLRRAPAAPVIEAAVAPTPAPVTLKPADPPPPSPKDLVGYKSLIEANAGAPPVAPVFPDSPDDSVSKHHRGNRFLHVLGKILHPGRQPD